MSGCVGRQSGAVSESCGKTNKCHENETRRKRNVSERRTIHDSDGETGRKSGKEKGRAAKQINVVVMHEDDMASTKCDGNGMPIPAENEMGYRGSQERTRQGRQEEARSRTVSIEGETSEGMKGTSR